MSFNNTGKVWSVDAFAQYLKTIKPPAWAKAVCLHHTSSPTLNQRPNGFLAQHLENLKDYYSRQLGWHGAPHLFIDEDQAWGMNPLTETGVHASSFNRLAIGIEVLGDYDNEEPTKGRGLQCWQTATAITKLLLDWLSLPVNDKTVLFHRDDPKTTKTCPGGKVGKAWVINLIKNSSVPKTEPVSVSFSALVPELEKKGYSSEEIKKGLKISNGKVYWRDKWLEKAYYDKYTQTTFASTEEINLIEQNQ